MFYKIVFKSYYYFFFYSMKLFFVNGGLDCYVVFVGGYNDEII